MPLNVHIDHIVRVEPVAGVDIDPVVNVPEDEYDARRMLSVGGDDSVHAVGLLLNARKPLDIV